MSRLCPVWRLVPNGTGVGAIAVDPAEARFVLERGWASLDGERWNANLDGWDGQIDKDGRIAMRLVKA